MPPTIEFLADKPLKEVCTLGIGGLAQFYVEARSIEELRQALQICKKRKLRYFILGKGSNSLFDDKGFHGVVIHNKIDFCDETLPGTIRVGAGYSFSLLGTQTARKGWSGLEFASGIPGTVGGAVFMNAGANGTETGEHISSVDFITDDGELKQYQTKKLDFSYRSSPFHHMSGAIAAATFQLKYSDEARKEQIKIINYRKKTQPYGKKSAGCMFRNPPNHHAGALIEQCGFKGYKVGGAIVSDLHANFVINTGNGTSKDIVQLVNSIKNGVQQQMGITLESEVRYIPYCLSQHDRDTE